MTNTKLVPKIKKGSGIHINPKNKGKFTETKEKTGKSTAELTHSKNPLTRKRAIFAQNAKKWHHKKHEEGGSIEFINTLINEFKSGGNLPTFQKKSSLNIDFLQPLINEYNSTNTIDFLLPAINEFKRGGKI